MQNIEVLYKMEGKEKKLFKNPSAESLEIGQEKITNTSTIDCTIKEKETPKKYVKYSLSESILFNSK
ncbi:uncharacterized protein NEMAJ01_1879 [Nematocida major]|uniref:uncharacterized protein n=1 Tax=Nematocida major TaxID=1912982 RepID=UPI002007FCCC|nr:uncharacterized protein NEMAJ01_1879 [Nematocida major]KAH9386983.1 hypothetical protein NEMAJ01_1879 [Nematocida major]